MDDGSIDALREVLQDMSNTVELLSSGSKSGDALILFLEDVLRTIEAWAAKYNVGLEDTDMSTECPKLFVQDAEDGRNAVAFQVSEIARNSVGYQDERTRDFVVYEDSEKVRDDVAEHDSAKSRNAINFETGNSPQYSKLYLDSEAARNSTVPFQASEEARNAMEYPNAYQHSHETRKIMQYSKAYQDSEARNGMDYPENETRNPNSHADLHPIPSSYGNTFSMLKNDHHSNLTSRTSLAVDACQTIDQLELALDLDQDVHVNVNELMDLADQRIMHSNDGNESEGGSFSWEVHEHKGEIQFREERQGAFGATEQEFAFHDNRMDCTNQSSCEMHVVKEDDSVIQRQSHLTSSVDSSCVENMIFKCEKDHLDFSSPSHMPKNRKLDMASHYNVVAQPKAYEGRRDAMNSSEWLDKSNANETHHNVMDSNLR